MNISVLTKPYMRSDVPEIRQGDTVRIHQKIREGDKERISIFEGLVIAKKHGTGISGTFTVRKVVDGIGVERVFPAHSPMIAKIDVVRHSHTRRAKLYFIRDKAAREVRRKMKQVWYEAAPAKAAVAEPAAE